MIRLPGGEQRRINEIVELVDLAPTLLDLAGIESDPSTHLDGASLTGLMNGTATDWKNYAICENYWPKRIERDGTEHSEDYGRCLIEDGFKCCIGGNMPYDNCLFELRTDPNELTNLWDESEHRERREQMSTKLRKNWNRIPEPQLAYSERG